MLASSEPELLLCQIYRRVNIFWIGIPITYKSILICPLFIYIWIVPVVVASSLVTRPQNTYLLHIRRRSSDALLFEHWLQGRFFFPEILVNKIGVTPVRYSNYPHKHFKCTRLRNLQLSHYYCCEK